MRIPFGVMLPDAALLRVPVDPRWADPRCSCPLPAVPDGQVVTASVNSPSAEGVLLTLELRGYRPVGVQSAPLLPPGLAFVDLLAPVSLAVEAPDWWRQVAACADRVLPLACGPVHTLLRQLLTVHATAGG